jgi:hypothetical protein
MMLITTITLPSLPSQLLSVSMPSSDTDAKCCSMLLYAALAALLMVTTYTCGEVAGSSGWKSVVGLLTHRQDPAVGLTFTAQQAATARRPRLAF